MFIAKIIASLTLLLPLLSFASDNNCTPFQWVTDWDGEEKSAMVVTTIINGHRADLQFDTGSDVNVLYGAEQAEAFGLEVTERDFGTQVTQSSLTAGNIDLASQTFVIVPYPPAQVAGRIGLKSLLGKIVQIDYPNNQICLLDTLQYYQSRQHTRQVSARIHSNKFFLTATINKHPEQELFFDTGASLYELLVDKTLWQKLTGRRGDEKDNKEIQGWANDKLVTTVGAPMLGSIQLGDMILPTPLAHFTRERPNYFTERHVSAIGLLGNALFFDRKVILDLRKKYTWFSVFNR